MKKLIYLMLLLVFIFNSNAEYKYVKINFSGSLEYKTLLSSGIDVQNAIIKDNSHILVILNDNEYISLSKQFNIEIIQDNYEKFLIEKYKKINKNYETLQSGKYFSTGSYAGHFTLQEIEDNFNLMMEKFPNWISKIEIGRSFENRPIVAYCFGPNGCMTDMSHPEVLITGVLHAREPIGATLIVYTAWKLLELLENNDPEIMYLLNNRNIVLLPIFNPDGYEINYKTSPSGGGLWRKNARVIDGEITGVDLNRNYGPQEYWDFDGKNALKSTSNETYPGPEPFSEPETQAIKNFLDMHNFKFAFNYHTFGNMLIYPYNHRIVECADSTYFRDFSNYISRKNSFVFGTTSRIINYVAQGGSDDYMWETKGINSFTVEVGSQLDGFYTIPDNIIPLCEVNYDMIKQLIWSASSNIIVKRIDYNYKDDGNMQLTATIQNIGTETSSTTELNINPLNSAVRVENQSNLIPPLDKDEEIQVILNLQNNLNIENGIYLPIQTSIKENNISKIDTFTVQYYHPIIYKIDFDETLNDFIYDENWWSYIDDVENDFIISSNFEIYYSDSANSIFQFPTFFYKTNHLSFEFTSKWAIELNFDFIELQIFNYKTSNWDNLNTNKMQIGLGLSGSRQVKDKQGFAGYMPFWTKQEVNLDSYKDDSIRIRFILKSDNGSSFEGFRVKDIKFKLYNEPSAINEFSNNNVIFYPNPIKTGEVIRISSMLDLSNTQITITNILGEIVYQDFSNKGLIQTKGFASGIYFVKLLCNNQISTQKLVVTE